MDSPLAIAAVTVATAASIGTALTGAVLGAKSGDARRWRRLEIVGYVALLATALAYGLPYMEIHLTKACEASSHCAVHLKPGWLFGRKVDLSDYQWRDFRGNLPLLTAMLAAFVVLSRTARRVGLLLQFYLAASTVFVFYTYGAQALFMLALALLNYVILRLVGGIANIGPIVIWVVNIAMVMSTEWLHTNYQFRMLHWRLAWLDLHEGSLRWFVGFNLVTLRMISFAMDYHWAVLKVPVDHGKKRDDREERADAAYESRVAESRPLGEYSLARYFAYLFYIPLQLAGPTTTANAFLAHLQSPQTTYDAPAIAKYGLRVANALLMMEVMTHYLPCWAVARSGTFGSLTPYGIGMLGYLSLHLIWLKFFIIWRFFRFFALADGVEVVENMNRCMSNNYNLQGFWRSWHRSFNRWLIRYVFVPLGGSRHRFRNTFAVFTFTAVWHDLSLSLLTWGWMLAVFIVPESLLTAYVARPSMKGLRDSWYYRHLCALGGALNIFFMMVVNLIGFSVGVGGMAHFLATIFTLDSTLFLSLTIAVFFSATNIMFAWREAEGPRKGF